jgi:hypothetical protein
MNKMTEEALRYFEKVAAEKKANEEYCDGVPPRCLVCGKLLRLGSRGCLGSLPDRMSRE